MTVTAGLALGERVGEASGRATAGPPSVANLPRENALDGFLLDGRELDVELREAVTGADLVETTEGASTLTITLRDEDDKVLRSGLLDAAPDADLGELKFRFVGVDTNPPALTLTFEDRDVARMREHDEPRSVARDKATRIEAVMAWVAEVKNPSIPVFAPEAHVAQPVAKAAPEEREQAAPGGAGRAELAADDGVTVKGQEAGSAERRVLSAVLRSGNKRAAPRRALVGAVMCVTQESAAQNLPLRGGHRGPFQQDPRYWPASGDVEKDADAFYAKFVPLVKANPTARLGDLVEQVQRAGLGGQPYEQWRSEAEQTVEAWQGAGRPGGAKAGRTERFQFRRGEPGQREDTWTAAGRLMDEVNFSRFMRRGTLWLVSEDYLNSRPSRMTCERGARGVVQVAGQHDSGKKFQTITVTCYLADAAALPGDVVTVRGKGKTMNGRYIVTERRRSLFSQLCTLACARPTPKAAEPRAEVTATAGGGSDGNALTFATRSEAGRAVADAYRKAVSIGRRGEGYAYGGGHGSFAGPYDCSGFVSAVLNAGGLGVSSPMDTVALGGWGKSGKGRWLTVWVRPLPGTSGHTFLEFTVNGKSEFYESGGTRGAKTGIRPGGRSTAGFQPRHYPGT